MQIKWDIFLSPKAVKQRKKLPRKVRFLFDVLLKEMSIKRPYRNNWSHYGKLKNQPDSFHCHVKDGRPTYVACWKVKEKMIKLAEVYYVGTHEDAPY